MAYEENLSKITVPANADLSASQYCLVVINSSGKLALATATAKADGVLQDKPSAADDAGCLAINGVSKVKAGAAITAGDDISVGSSGKAATSTSGDIVVGRALTAASGDGAIFSMLIVRAPEPLA